MKLRIDMEMCIGCRRCELACSLNHYDKDSVNPKKSRIRAWIKDDKIYPVVSGPFNNAACTSKHEIMIGDRVYDGCSVCRAPCPEKSWFQEPDTGILLKCDFCGEPADPNCVKWCPCNAIVAVDDNGEIIPYTMEKE